MKKQWLIWAVCTLVPFYSFSQTREEALRFLYTTMSLPDKTDYTEEFYLSNVDASLRARQEMSWGHTVPEREFLHFVLPVRVNNEHLDNSRTVFYGELKERVKGLSMAEAILEVNHWCHEKVTYRPSDARTSSPLSAVSQAIGRCGEESTFLVAALRAVGIPARQIYTPRWAHTDDNHAWVEAWADGHWHFLGACEPEPVLDLAWFNSPASRGLLMTTDVPGDYRGPEEQLSRNRLFTRINVTENYAPVGKMQVVVTDTDGQPVEGATVNFCIYNYAEYYPAVTRMTGKDGCVSLTSGLGDMVVWASDGRRFGFGKVCPALSGAAVPLQIMLDKDCHTVGRIHLDLAPPVSRIALPEVTPAQRAENDRRMHREDSIRNAYTATFVTSERACRIAGELGVDSEALTGVLVESRGNHDRLAACLSSLPADHRTTALRLLQAVSEKDRRDIPVEVITDHVLYAPTAGAWSEEVYNNYVLNPRIENEFLTPWRSVLATAFSDNQRKKFCKDPQRLAEWVGAHIAPADTENPKSLRMSPIGVWTERRADALSADIFFVAAARSLGIPARIDPVTGTTQYTVDGRQWQNVVLRSQATGKKARRLSPAMGRLRLTFAPLPHVEDPKYYSQFSISRIVGGIPRLLEFDEDATLSSLFPLPRELEAGQYILTTGQRLADGGVLVSSELFTLKAGETLTLDMELRHDDSALSVIGAVNAENLYDDLSTGATQSLLSATGRGYYVLGLIAPNHEPSTHALNDISAVSAQLEASGKKIMLLFEDAGKAARFDADTFPGLPSNVVFGVDTEGMSKRELVKSLNLEDQTYPIFVVADTFNRIVWVSTGYTIGIGETLLSILSRVD